MSVSNVSDVAIRLELRALRREVSELRGQIASFIKNNSVSTYHSSLLDLTFAGSGHTGFASSSDLTAHTANTSNPHLTTLQQAAAAGGEIGYIAVSATAPDGRLWWDTTATPPWFRMKQPDGQWSSLWQAAP